jgi:hypothetical protein
VAVVGELRLLQNVTHVQEVYIPFREREKAVRDFVIAGSEWVNGPRSSARPRQLLPDRCIKLHCSARLNRTARTAISREVVHPGFSSSRALVIIPGGARKSLDTIKQNLRSSSRETFTISPPMSEAATMPAAASRSPGVV